MPAGRKPMGIEQVELLPGSTAAKLRLEVLLANVAGELTVEQACAAMGVHKTRFFELRKRWLQESVEALEPEPAGRPVGSVPETCGMSLHQPIDPEIGSDAEKRPSRIASNASAEASPTPDTSRNASARGTLGRIAELEELLAQTRWELHTSRLREELAALGLSRPKVAGRAQKKTPLSGKRPHGKRGESR